MRVSHSILALSGLLGLANATGSKGGAERAAYFMTYIMEEVYGDDKSKMTIAPNCPGTRTGLRGQAGRCSLLELCDYLWTDRVEANTNRPLGDTKPNKANVEWASSKTNEFNNLDANKIMNGIMTAKENVVQPDGSTRSVVLNKVEHGYIGGTDPVRLNGESDWYRANQKVGDSMRNAVAAINAADDATKKIFERWIPRSAEASKMVVYLRISDANQIALGKANGYSRFAGGRPISSKPYDIPAEDRKLIQGNMKEVDRDATIKAWQSEISITDRRGAVTTFPALSEADATSTFDRAVTDAKAADGNRHQMAIDAAQESERRRTMSCP